MASYVVDASIAVKWLVTETFSDIAARLLEPQQTLIAPELLFAEASNALWTICRRGDINREDCAEAVDALRASPVSVPSSMRQLMPSASRLSVDLDHPVYDCFYLALALQNNYPVITADTRFHAKVHEHPFLSGHIQHIAETADSRL